MKRSLLTEIYLKKKGYKATSSNNLKVIINTTENFTKKSLLLLYNV